ncbi:MAG: hypothetical protein KC657_27915 [Myxococcales bacterium]|nr:hypothetical protein [Myxococcales bacterium]
MRLFSLAALVAIVATAAGCAVETVVEQAPENEQEAKSAVLTTPQMERKAGDLIAQPFDRQFDQDLVNRVQGLGNDTTIDRDFTLDTKGTGLRDEMNRKAAGIGNADIRDQKTPFGAQ